MSYLALSVDSPFPVLSNDIAMRQATAHKDEIRWQDQPNGTVVCSYMVSMEATFDDMYSREARGIVFNDGKVVARSLHKFFNVNEKPSTLIEALDWTQVVRVMDKRDGSMIHTVAVDDSPFEGDNFDVKSKKSYSSDVANSAREFIMEHSEYLEFCSDIVSENRTATFEWTSPSARIVLAYGKDELKLLHVRDNVTGEYATAAELQELAWAYKIPMVDDITLVNGIMDVKIDYEDDVGKSFKSVFIDFNASNKEIQAQLLSLVEQAQGIEGWIFQFKNGDMVKLKTKWYMERHRAMTFLRERDVALMVLREGLDDLKALLVTEGANISEILEIEERTVLMLNSIEQSIERAYESQKHLPKKDFAIFFQTSNDGKRHPFFSLLMSRHDGKEIDIKGYFERNFLPNIPLRQLNLVQSVAEAE